MEIKTTTIKELSKDNKRMCLSALRSTDNCIKCMSYDTCESRKINLEKDRLRTIILNKKAELKAEILRTDEDLKALLSGGSESIERLKFNIKRKGGIKGK